MELVSVAGVAENGVIGNDGGVPWPDLPKDVEQYRDRVAGSPVILGRRTFESMRANLPGSRRIVVSRSLDAVDEPTAVIADGVEAAIERARDLAPDGVVYVLGGGTIYDLFQPHVNRMALSRIEGRYEGDVRYPEWDEADWDPVAETEYDGFTVREWRRSAGE